VPPFRRAAATPRQPAPMIVNNRLQPAEEASRSRMPDRLSRHGRQVLSGSRQRPAKPG